MSNPHLETKLTIYIYMILFSDKFYIFLIIHDDLIKWFIEKDVMYPYFTWNKKYKL